MSAAVLLSDLGVELRGPTYAEDARKAVAVRRAACNQSCNAATDCHFRESNGETVGDPGLRMVVAVAVVPLSNVTVVFRGGANAEERFALRIRS